MIRVFDVVFSLLGLLLGLPVFMCLYVIGLIDTGAPVFRQERVGRHQRGFTLLKFRTMRPDTASVASHLADASAITPFGRFLRRTKLDELPQLWNVVRGEMSLVGPRPCLFNQEELIAERATRGVFDARPGITGLAQVNNIDMSMPRLLAETDARMMQELNISAYFRFIFMAARGRGSGDRVRYERQADNSREGHR
jgi:lipopolysaccharide/colanic/teichoic acid biosynthesis glycosyltransferase